MEADIAFIFVYAMRAVRGFFVDRGSYLPVFERAMVPSRLTARLMVRLLLDFKRELLEDDELRSYMESASIASI